MFDLLFVAMLATWTPGADDPVCEVGQVVEIDHCAQGQLPEETIGREIDAVEPTVPTEAVPVTVVDLVVVERPVTTLAETGVPVLPYLAFTLMLVGGGTALVRTSRKNR